MIMYLLLAIDSYINHVCVISRHTSGLYIAIPLYIVVLCNLYELDVTRTSLFSWYSQVSELHRFYYKL